MKPLTILIGLLCGLAQATTYYVDPAGCNANDGLSPQTRVADAAESGDLDVQAGRRDSCSSAMAVWNEWLTPPSSGTAGNLIKFDAYGNGRPPEFTGYYATTAAQWTNTSGNVWQIALSATQAISQLKFVQFGTMWGNSQTAQSLLAHDRDWYYDSGDAEFVCVVGERKSGHAFWIGDADDFERAVADQH